MKYNEVIDNHGRCELSNECCRLIYYIGWFWV